MIMKLKFILLLIILVFGIGIGIWLGNNSVDTKSDHLSENEMMLDPAFEPFHDKFNEYKQLKKEGKKEEAEKIKDDVFTTLPEEYQKYFEFGFKAGMEPIGFYGKVVDQYGVPVIGAKVPYCTAGKFLAAGKGCGTTLTDADGHFMVDSAGSNLTLSTIQHPETEFSFPIPKGPHGFPEARIWQMTFYGYQHSYKGNDPLWTDTSKDKPYIFKAWRVQDADQVYIGFTKAALSPDGALFTVDFTKPRRKQVFKGKSEGHLYLSCKRKPVKDKLEKVLWEVEIIPNNGGIQSTNDLYMNEAPESGYQDKLVIQQDPTDESFKRTLTRLRYYIKTKGNLYGSLYLDIYPNGRGRTEFCIVAINQFKLNPTGSTNLAMKKKEATNKIVK